MMRQRKFPAEWLGVTIALLWTTVAAAGPSEKTFSQLHFRTGPISGTFSGPVTGGFSVVTPLDLDYEFFLDPRNSMSIRMTLANDTALGRVAYAYMGLGKRWYFLSQGQRIDSRSGGDQVTLRPSRRFYGGVDLGVSQVLLSTTGAVLETRSDLIDLGGHVGAIQQIGPDFGIELNAGYSMGIGFSSVSASATIIRTFLGVSYFF